MVHPYLQNKINDSYDILRLAAEMSQEYYHKPLILTYSGGKDSDVMLQLAIECLKPSDFEVLNSHTTVDAPETVYYIRDKFKELENLGIKTTVQKSYYPDGTPKTMWNLIVNKGVPPTRLMRYCCQHLKETSTPNRFVAVGVRESESTGRRNRDVFATRGLRKKDAYYYYYSHIKEVFDDDRQRRIGGGIDNPNEEGPYDCRFISKAKKNDDLICNPIYKWTDTDVWDFIRDRGLKYNPLYDKGFQRVGCIGCPLAGNQVQELEMYPKIKQIYIDTFQRMVERRRENGKGDTSPYGMTWKDGQSVYDWWIGCPDVPGQMTFEDYEDEE